MIEMKCRENITWNISNLITGLDFEISTYHKLLEGEEYRLQSVTAPVLERAGRDYSLRRVVEEYEQAYKNVSNDFNNTEIKLVWISRDCSFCIYNQDSCLYWNHILNELISFLIQRISFELVWLLSGVYVWDFGGTGNDRLIIDSERMINCNQIISYSPKLTKRKHCNHT